VVSCEKIVTVPTAAIGRRVGQLLPAQEPALAAAIRTAFDLV
jgi:mRNA interferase MazF